MARRSGRLPPASTCSWPLPADCSITWKPAQPVSGAVEFLVLDEVDQMLDLGFIKPIRRIVRELPRKRQNLFFSATMPADIRALAGELLSDPIEVAVTPAAKTADRVEQTIIFVDAAKKRDMLVELCGDAAMSRVLVFTRTKRGADRVAKALDESGVDAAAIHGNKSQGQRERALGAFREGKTRVLVATDIAARGIDIESVTHVVNFELPEVAETYVHRIGRTARAGNGGQAISLCDHEERDLLRAIERLTRLTLPKIDRRGAAGPRPAPLVRKAVSAGASAPAPERPHHSRPRDARSGRSARRRQTASGASSAQLPPDKARVGGVKLSAYRSAARLGPHDEPRGSGERFPVVLARERDGALAAIELGCDQRADDDDGVALQKQDGGRPRAKAERFGERRRCPRSSRARPASSICGP